MKLINSSLFNNQRKQPKLELKKEKAEEEEWEEEEQMNKLEGRMLIMLNNL